MVIYSFKSLKQAVNSVKSAIIDESIEFEAPMRHPGVASKIRFENLNTWIVDNVWYTN